MHDMCLCRQMGSVTRQESFAWSRAFLVWQRARMITKSIRTRALTQLSGPSALRILFLQLILIPFAAAEMRTNLLQRPEAFMIARFC